MNKDIINLTIPRKPDYISLVRLTTSGIAYSMGLNVDDIEDIKVSIGEACINSLMSDGKEEISLVFEIDEEKLSIEVMNVKEEIPDDLEEKRERELGLLIIKSLMDEVIFNEDGIKMVKYIEVDNQ
ncbi:ATP-binding protein [Tissierella praeacuta]|uniref:Serine/threonine-protein kinase RsbW n=1 Tax=Tissierella praeacuta DSM 18095 TaxID=1123404 RepID=A0A1M4Z1C8_9FIRM|nr:ATP-binding protein [Tissierella praeacuta]TCU66261.1 serine/threonine-protein kinase RsbW [Tissierella praeacuta]SHF11607.1 serine/threonine-protein kinase RsbW [Tissierella praeacuta DSM 18095]SUO98830.1 Serine-protein kinase rsbW [Tissierella praeacuta]